MKQDELERVIQYWEGYLGGMRCVSNIDSAEIFATLPPDLQAVALEMYKILVHMTQMDETEKTRDELVDEYGEDEVKPLCTKRTEITTSLQ